MVEDPLVRKFGFKMRFLRQRDATAVMRVSKDFLDPKALEIMYVEYFEPSRTSSDLTMFGVQFLEFCLKIPLPVDPRRGRALPEDLLPL